MDQRVQMVIDFIIDDLRRKLSLSDMAHSVNLSSSRFRHLFKAETGISPAQYLRLLRMQRARELIETTFLSMKEVMVKVGVSDKRHFAEDFKKVYGLTPAQYRKYCLSSNLFSKNAGIK